MFHLKVQVSLFVPSTHVYTCSDIFVLCILQCLPEFYNYVGSQIPLLFSSIGCHLRDSTFSDYLQSTEIFSSILTYLCVGESDRKLVKNDIEPPIADRVRHAS